MNLVQHDVAAAILMSLQLIITQRRKHINQFSGRVMGDVDGARMERIRGKKVKETEARRERETGECDEKWSFVSPLALFTRTSTLPRILLRDTCFNKNGSHIKF